jgi:hypothetical protein
VVLATVSALRTTPDVVRTTCWGATNHRFGIPGKQ